MFDAANVNLNLKAANSHFRCPRHSFLLKKITALNFFFYKT